MPLFVKNGLKLSSTFLLDTPIVIYDVTIHKANYRLGCWSDPYMVIFAWQKYWQKNPQNNEWNTLSSEEALLDWKSFLQSNLASDPTGHVVNPALQVVCDIWRLEYKQSKLHPTLRMNMTLKQVSICWQAYQSNLLYMYAFPCNIKTAQVFKPGVKIMWVLGPMAHKIACGPSNLTQAGPTNF